MPYQTKPESLVLMRCSDLQAGQQLSGRLGCYVGISVCFRSSRYKHSSLQDEVIYPVRFKEPRRRRRLTQLVIFKNQKRRYFIRSVGGPKYLFPDVQIENVRTQSCSFRAQPKV